MDEITRDIVRKCDEDVAGAIHRNMVLVEGASAMSQVALMGAASALGAAGGAFLALHQSVGGDNAPSEEVADALWAMLRPMVVRSTERQRARKGG